MLLTYFMNFHVYRSYPQEVYDIILAYHSHFPPNRSGHKGGNTRLLDLGCGPGFIASTLAPHFEHTLGLDPSPKMVKVGLQPVRGEHVEYKVGNAEDLDSAGVGVGDNGVDLVVAGMSTFLNYTLVPIPPPPLSSCLFSNLFCKTDENGDVFRTSGALV